MWSPQLRYDYTTKKLHATVVECRHLPKTELIGKSDPYVRVYLMPGTHMELKTKIVKSSQNPVYNDEFSFVVSELFAFRLVETCCYQQS